MQMVRHIGRRRRVLRQSIDIGEAFEAWKESCVPSYCHPNLFAAYTSWLRLFAVARMLRRAGITRGRVLDFGSSVGELGHLLSEDLNYEFVEQSPAAVQVLTGQLPRAVRQTLETAPKDAYDAVFAIDALEHNENYPELLGTLASLLSPGGVLILSGPTENALYRLGRRIAGFSGDYHVTTIAEIEAAAAGLLNRVAARTIPFGAPLFRITAWRRPRPSA